MESTPSTPMTDPNQASTPSGLLVIDKSLGNTSMRVCSVVRARLRAGGAPKRVKVGHAGTLDPLATGVLVVLVGRATRLCERVMGGAKGYLAEIDLAHVSPTDDFESDPEPVELAEAPSREDVRAACARFVGQIRQVPPAHSAIKVDGKRAYTEARAGRAPDLAPRSVRIDSIEVRSYQWPRATLEIRCGKGVYIRSLARDLGRALGAGGMLASLRRTRVGPFSLEHAATLDALPPTLTQRDLRPVPPELLARDTQ